MNIKTKFRNVGAFCGKVSMVLLTMCAYGFRNYLNQQTTQYNNERCTNYDDFIYESNPTNTLYGRAVNAICKSNMGSWDKSLAIRELSKHGDEAYYEAAIAIANDNSAGSRDRLTAIRGIRSN